MVGELSSNRKTMRFDDQMPGNGFVCKDVYFGLATDGAFIGLPALIIETAQDGRFFSVDEIITKLKAHSIKNVVIRGFEPLKSPALAGFMKVMESIRVAIQLEAGGTMSYSNYVGFKTATLWTHIYGPSFGKVEQQELSSIAVARDKDGVSFHVATPADFQWVLSILKAKRTSAKVHFILEGDTKELTNIFLYATELFIQYPHDADKFKMFPATWPEVL